MGNFSGNITNTLLLVPLLEHLEKENLEENSKKKDSVIRIIIINNPNIFTTTKAIQPRHRLNTKDPSLFKCCN